MNLLRSSGFQLAFIYLTVFSGSVLVLIGFIYWTTAGYMARQSDETVQAEIEGLAEQYRRQGLDALVAVIRDRVARDPDRSSVYLLTWPNYKPIIGNLNGWPDVPVAADGWMDFELEGGEDEAAHAARARPFRLRGNLALLVGRDVQDLIEIQTMIKQSLIWGLAITLALGIAGGLMLTGSTLRRIETINQTSREIMNGDLSQRIPTRGSGDDFDQVAENLNLMLNQIEQLMTGVRNVSDNIAHDLRTPLARLRNRLESMHTSAGNDGDLVQELSACTEEADHLLATFNALLRISRIESGALQRPNQEVDLSKVVEDACDLYEAVADEQQRGLRPWIESQVVLPGDRDLLFQAVSNMLDNAIKYARRKVDVRLTPNNAGAELTVADDGPGIPEAERDKVLERFYRLESSRTTAGSGLGLSLVAAVARLHDAELELGDNYPGLKITLRLNR